MRKSSRRSITTTTTPGVNTWAARATGSVEKVRPRISRGRTFSTDPVALAAQVFTPGVVVVVMDLLDDLRIEDLGHLGYHRVATRIGISPGQLHSLDVLRTEVRMLVEPDRHRVHPVGCVRSVQEPGGDLMPQSSRSEVDPDPDPVLLIEEQVH